MVTYSQKKHGELTTEAMEKYGITSQQFEDALEIFCLEVRQKKCSEGHRQSKRTKKNRKRDSTAKVAKRKVIHSKFCAHFVCCVWSMKEKKPLYLYVWQDTSFTFNPVQYIDERYLWTGSGASDILEKLTQKYDKSLPVIVVHNSNPSHQIKYKDCRAAYNKSG